MENWHALDPESLSRAASERREKAGPNRLQEQAAVRWPKILMRQFASVLIFILAAAAVLSFFIGDKIDAAAIVAVIFLNAFLGFAQEWKAETALKGLKKMLSPRCRVIRDDGRAEEVDAESLRPGDRVFLAMGNAVPADMRLLLATDLKADESALTGESVPVSKETGILPENTPLAERSNMVWMGTSIVNGHGEGIVVATGMESEFGRIAGLTGAIGETQTRLQAQLGILGRQLGALALFTAIAVIVIGITDGRDVADMLMTGISLAVAAVPEGLPAVVTITLAFGIGIMARKKALLRRLQAAETLGAVSVICTDKTGTLTKNEMTVQKIWLAGRVIEVTGAGYVPEGGFLSSGKAIEPQLDGDLMILLDTARTCNHARIERRGQEWRPVGSPTEAALMTLAEKAGLKQEHNSVSVAEYAFNSTRKLMSMVTESEKDFTVHAKGAPEAVLQICTHILVDGRRAVLTEALRTEIEQTCRLFALEGLRTLAMAQKRIAGVDEITQDKVESGLTFLGIAGFTDPPRPEVHAALEKACRAGIKVIVITGDSADTAMSVARKIGLDADRTITGLEMRDMGDEELSFALKGNILFARTVPEDKFRIVRLLQAQGQLVAMTGDGVNDAPALKQADIGIAMGLRGTDVAKGAADIVLTDDNFASIIAAIEEGRRQYANIRKFVQFLMAHNIGEVTAIFANILMGGPLILLPIQILWINLATDSVTALSLSVERAERNIMDEPPRAVNRPILDWHSVVPLAALGGYIGLATLALFHLYLPVSHDLANTVALTAIVVTAQVLVLNFRSLSGPTSSVGWFSNPWILAAIAAMIGLQAAAVYMPAMQVILHTVPLSAYDWAVIFTAAMPLFIVPEAIKFLRKKKT